MSEQFSQNQAAGASASNADLVAAIRAVRPTGTIAWSSSAPDVATVDSAGLLTAKDLGVVTIGEDGITENDLLVHN